MWTARQGLGQIAVALVGHDDAGAGFGDQEIGAGDADIGAEKLRAQQGAGFVAQLARLGERPLRVERAMRAAEGVGHLFFDQMHRRRDQVARRFVAQLDDVFAEIGLDRANAVFFEEIVEPDFLGDHRLALGDGLGAGSAADLHDRVAGFLGRARPMHRTARRDDLLLVSFEVKVEMGERMLLDRAADIAQRVEFGQPRHDLAAARRKAPLRHDFERLLQVLVGKPGAGIRREIAAGGVHRC